MKSILLTILFGGIFAWSAAQSVQYRVLHDQPIIPKVSVNLELFNLNMGINNLDGTAYNVGAFGFVQPFSRLGFNYQVRKSLFALGTLGYKDYPGNLDINLGAYFNLRESTKLRKAKVELSREYKGSEFRTTVSGDRVEQRNEAVTTITIPAQVYRSLGARGGIYMKNGPFNFEAFEIEGSIVSSPIQETSLFSSGIYVGMLNRSIRNVFIETDQYGVKFNSIGDDIILDLLIVPVNQFSDLNNDGADVSEIAKEKGGKSPFGFRVGWSKFQVEKKYRTGKMFGLSGSFEAGYKPFQGWFISGGIGMTIIKV